MSHSLRSSLQQRLRGRVVGREDSEHDATRARFGPRNLFRMNQNIRPAAMEAQ